MSATKSIRWWRRNCLADKGYAEQPLGSNNTKFGVKFGWDKVAWCVIYGWCKYQAAGVTLPLKTASCIALYDHCVTHGLRYDSDHGVPGDSVIRTWQHMDRHDPRFNPEQTHFQEILRTKTVNGRKWLGLWGGNQGAGYVGPSIEWVPAGDPSILGALAFHRLFHTTQKPAPAHNKKTDAGHMPAAKSHKHAPAPEQPHRKAKKMTHAHSDTSPAAKPGYKTTEFWSHLIAQAVAILTLVGQFNTSSPLGNALIKLAAVLGSAGAAAGYANARGKAKQGSTPKST